MSRNDAFCLKLEMQTPFPPKKEHCMGFKGLWRIAKPATSQSWCWNTVFARDDCGAAKLLPWTAHNWKPIGITASNTHLEPYTLLHVHGDCCAFLKTKTSTTKIYCTTMTVDLVSSGTFSIAERKTSEARVWKIYKTNGAYHAVRWRKHVEQGMFGDKV